MTAIPLFSWSLSFLRPYRPRVVAIALLAVAEIVLAAMAPWPLKALVDNVLGGQPFPTALAEVVTAVTGGNLMVLLIVVVAVGLAVQLLLELVRAAHTQVQVDTGQRIVYDLRARLLGHIQALPLRNHVLGRTADSVYRLDADAYCVNDMVIGGVFPLAAAALNLTVMFAILVGLDATLGLLSLAVAPFLYVCLRYYARTMTDHAESVKAQESTLIERAYEILSSITAIKSFAREEHELGRFSRAGEATMQARLRLTWQESVFSVSVTAITLTGTALVLVVGGLHVLQGTLTVGGLLVVVAYLGAVYNPLSSIAHTTGSLQQALVSARRVREVFALAPEQLDAEGAVDAAAIRGDVAFEDVSFAYDEGRPILDRVSFKAHPGEMVALVGLTGAGKTTIANLIPRFFEPTSGRVLVDGLDVAGYRLRSLRERIALVPQEPVLFGGTIGDNIRYGRLDASDDEVETAARAAHVHDFVARLPEGYATPVAETGATLSGGERQRLGIARALLKKAPILILDEPTSSLDAISEEMVFKALRSVREGRTTIVIAHRLSTIRDADRILVLHDGRLLAQGTHEGLIGSNELYRRMCARLSVGRSLDEPESVDELFKALA
jgi:ATP-binding cassette subfamily B protein